MVAIGRWHARVHLVVGVPDTDLGQQYGTLTDVQVAGLRDALAALIGRR